MTEEDWQSILRSWLRECSEPDRFRRLLDLYSICLHDGNHPVEAHLYDQARSSGTFPKYFP
jgi:hypothetical protein